jgi:hypothetical protein
MLRFGWCPPDPESGEKQGVDDLLTKGASLEDLKHYLRAFQGYEIASESWPELAREAYHSLAGRIVRQILPHTEADAPALLFSFLTYVGCMVGRGAHFKVEGDAHYLKNFTVLVGKTSKGRKGTSQGRIDELMFAVNPGFMNENTASGLSSGEGLIENVRDAKVKTSDDGTTETIDHGVIDKRLLVTESEFASPLTLMHREGNILSMVLRNGWDDKVLRTLTRNQPLKSSGSHISIMGHITQRELRRHLTEEKLGAGIANRFLFALVHRSKSLPHGGDKNPVRPAERDELREAISFGGTPREILLSSTEEPEHGLSAYELWEEIYPDLSEGEEGLFGAITSRAEAHVRRLATIYAVLDQSPEVQVDHLLAGLAVWQFAEDSARYIFGDLRGNPEADTIHQELKHLAPEGLTKWDINGLFSGNTPAKKINGALEELLEARLITEETEKSEGRGRPAKRYYAAQ